MCKAAKFIAEYKDKNSSCTSKLYQLSEPVHYTKYNKDLFESEFVIISTWPALNYNYAIVLPSDMSGKQDSYGHIQPQYGSFNTLVHEEVLNALGYDLIEK
jgi:hypothetical protein